MSRSWCSACSHSSWSTCLNVLRRGRAPVEPRSLTYGLLALRSAPCARPATWAQRASSSSIAGLSGALSYPSRLIHRLSGNHPGPIELTARSAERREDDGRRHEIRFNRVVNILSDRPSFRAATRLQISRRKARNRPPNLPRNRSPRCQGRRLVHGACPRYRPPLHALAAGALMYLRHKASLDRPNRL